MHTNDSESRRYDILVERYRADGYAYDEAQRYASEDLRQASKTQPPDDKPRDPIYHDFNEDANFLPNGIGDCGVPTINLAGVLISGYLDNDGVLQVSVDLDDADLRIVSTRETVPMVIRVQGQAVHRAE
jgi:hypothetical protein